MNEIIFTIWAISAAVAQVAVNHWVRGSNPLSPAICSISLMVKYLLAMQKSRVRLSYIAPIDNSLTSFHSAQGYKKRRAGYLVNASECGRGYHSRHPATKDT